MSENVNIEYEATVLNAFKHVKTDENESYTEILKFFLTINVSSALIMLNILCTTQ